MEDLPLLDSPPRERADAARNRALVLQAAWRLYTSGGVEALTTDAVAQEAGVGKGTVYRRFRDKSGLVAALLDDREKELQLAMISGPAPLGPDGARTERRLAFVRAYLDYVEAHLDLLVASETAAPGARYRLGVYQFWKTHLTLLFADAYDPEFRAYTVLALLDASLIRHLRADGWSWERIRAGVEQEVRW
ncbi:TetR/AcrR family transcriptional regulator [Catenulispora yoronensis]|uniref:TetR/AcrR family transcriptional regulator n=1 Tax=Catenulispora yoronensis TaxID=450799 RepID=A0ABN2VCW2_9ACTN